MNSRHLLVGSVLCLAFFGGHGMAQTLSVINDTVTEPSGGLFSGIVQIKWIGGSGGSVAPTSSSARAYNGLLSVLLVPTTTVSPCAYYTATFTTNDGSTRFIQFWYVPPSISALTIAQVLTVSSFCTYSDVGSGGSSGSGPGGGSTGTLRITDISGLTTALAGKANKSATYNNSTAAWIDGLGNVGSIPGNATDCVKVNGMSGSCGATLPITISSVTGLSDTLAAFPVKGAKYAAGHTALVDGSGNLSTVIGNPSDCVHVDGSSGVCGSGGNPSLSVAFVDGETPVGALDGNNLTFTLSQAPSPATSLEIFRNGALMQSGMDFSLSVNTLTFLPSALPHPNDLLLAYYRVAGSTPAVTFVDGEVPGGSLDGTNATFTLTYAPTMGSGLRLYKNGVLLEASQDYTVSGAVVTFINSAQPNPGDTLLAYYRHEP